MNIMFFSDVPPCTNYTAGIVFNKLCDFLIDEGHRVSCCTLLNPCVTPEIPADKLGSMQFEMITKPDDNWGVTSPSFWRSIHGNWHVRITKLPGIAEQVLAFAKKNGAEIIWTCVEGQNLIWVADMVRRGFNGRFVVQIFDPPHWWLMENKVDAITYRWVMRVFGRMIHKADCCISISHAMKERYTKLYHTSKNIVVNIGLSPERVQCVDKHQEDFFTIVLSGQTYSRDEITALVSAMDNMNWEYAGKRLRFHVYGLPSDLPCLQNKNVEYKGFIKQTDLLLTLASADLLYCPYWFSSAFRESASLSFPSKLTTYFKTAVPVLIHAPEYAAPRRFIEENKAGYVCSSLDPIQIADTLRNIINDPERSEVGERGYNAFLEFLTVDVMKRNFLKALGIVNGVKKS